VPGKKKRPGRFFWGKKKRVMNFLFAMQKRFPLGGSCLPGGGEEIKQREKREKKKAVESWCPGVIALNSNERKQKKATFFWGMLAEKEGML